MGVLGTQEISKYVFSQVFATVPSGLYARLYHAFIVLFQLLFIVSCCVILYDVMLFTVWWNKDYENTVNIVNKFIARDSNAYMLCGWSCSECVGRQSTLDKLWWQLHQWDGSRHSQHDWWLHLRLRQYSTKWISLYSLNYNNNNNNWFSFLARSANLPTGLYILLAMISSFLNLPKISQHLLDRFSRFFLPMGGICMNFFYGSWPLFAIKGRCHSNQFFTILAFIQHAGVPKRIRLSQVRLKKSNDNIIFYILCKFDQDWSSNLGDYEGKNYTPL